MEVQYGINVIKLKFWIHNQFFPREILWNFYNSYLQNIYQKLPPTKVYFSKLKTFLKQNLKLTVWDDIKPWSFSGFTNIVKNSRSIIFRNFKNKKLYYFVDLGCKCICIYSGIYLPQYYVSHLSMKKLFDLPKSCRVIIVHAF